jgi:hypothetical protein
MKMDPIVSSETSTSNTQTPGIYPKESELHLQHGENLNLKSSILNQSAVIYTRSQSMLPVFCVGRLASRKLEKNGTEFALYYWKSEISQIREI